MNKIKTKIQNEPVVTRAFIGAVVTAVFLLAEEFGYFTLSAEGQAAFVTLIVSITVLSQRAKVTPFEEEEEV